MQLAEEMLRVEECSLYPALYRLEERGWIESEWGTSENNRRTRFYRLTRTGRKQLQVEEENWQRFALAIGKVMQTASGAFLIINYPHYNASAFGGG
jgi:PadR family transcriptional regulator PadR